ncbi:MAG: glycosyltransferase family 2 protein [Chitinophagaceae bacterium]|nr:glycosyltransferase family 2 protein [Chitinophagaceae bacterium]
MKIAAVVILYHPGQYFISNIRTYYNHVDKIFVFDNTETDSAVKEVLQQLSKVEFLQDYNNEGIAKRLNSGAQKAIQQQFEWMLMLDQDSYFSEESISNYFSCCNKYHSKENVAMFGTRYGRLKTSSSETCAPTEMHELITSGTLVNLNLFKKIGNFDEALFIDFVDHDYCIRAKIKGFSIIAFSNIYLSHELGRQVYRSSIKTLFLLKKRKAIHSPLRCYYMYRNLLYLEKKYENIKTPLLKNMRGTATGNILNSIFYGRDIIKTIKYFIAARNDYKKMKTGKIEKEL